MNKEDLLKRITILEKTIVDAEKEISSLSVYVQPYFKRDIQLEYTRGYGVEILDDSSCFGTVENFFTDNEIEF